MAGGCAAAVARAEISQVASPAPGIVCYSETRAGPPATRLLVAVIDLKNPGLRIRVAPGGPDPDGAGKWRTTLMTPTAIAEREHFALVVNGGFFAVPGLKDAEGALSGYRAGQWAAPVGPVVTDGRLWSSSRGGFACLIVHRDGSAAIKSISRPAAEDFEVVNGGPLLLRDGVPILLKEGARAPRTAAGLNAAGTKLVLLVLDGRRPGVAEGMTLAELTREMIHLGCWQALNLDGGGSSLMAVRDAKTGGMVILNHPTDGHERPVASVLGISTAP